MRERMNVCVCVCVKHERSSLPRPGSWTNGPFPPWSRGLLQSPSCPDGPGQPPHGSPQPLPTRLSLYCAQPGSSRKWGGCWVRGRPPAAPPPSPHCHSWLWPLAPAADAKNSLVHRETAAPLSGLPDWAWGQSCQDRLVVPGEGGEVHPPSNQGQSTIELRDLRSPSSPLWASVFSSVKWG